MQVYDALHMAGQHEVPIFVVSPAANAATLLGQRCQHPHGIIVAPSLAGACVLIAFLTLGACVHAPHAIITIAFAKFVVMR